MRRSVSRRGIRTFFVLCAGILVSNTSPAIAAERVVLAENFTNQF